MLTRAIRHSLGNASSSEVRGHADRKWTSPEEVRAARWLTARHPRTSRTSRTFFLVEGHTCAHAHDLSILVAVPSKVGEVGVNAEKARHHREFLPRTSGKEVCVPRQPDCPPPATPTIPAEELRP